jgi:sarcosine oxidase/L-pipecolate oxidase
MSETIWDAIVVGAGIEGSATAFELAKAEQKTLLLEQVKPSQSLSLDAVIFHQSPLLHSRGSSRGHSRIIRKAYDFLYFAIMMIDA